MIIGIDPGFTGAIAFLKYTNPKDYSLKIIDMPIHLILNRKQVKARELTEVIEAMGLVHPIRFAALENVHTMPTDGIVSAGTFMYNAGILLGVLAALNIKVLRVRPNVWKPALGLSSDKAKSLALARKRFPCYRHYFKRKMDDGRAEAALLAHFARECCV